jgi:phosphomannomutase
MSENKTEQEFIEMANHAKQVIEDKDDEIRHLHRHNHVQKRIIKKMSKLIINLQENIKKMEFLVDFHKGNLRNILGCFYGQLDDCVSTASIEISDADFIPKFDSSDESDNEEEEDINLTLHTILNLLGEPSDTVLSSQNQ